MIHQVQIENYKSIEKLTLELGCINVLIGENGCGKSNILEAIAFAGAAAGDKLDNEFLASRGVRVTDPRFMRSAFAGERSTQDIKIAFRSEGEAEFECSLQSEESPTYSRWIDTKKNREFERFVGMAVGAAIVALLGADKHSGRDPGSSPALLPEVLKHKAPDVDLDALKKAVAISIAQAKLAPSGRASPLMIRMLLGEFLVYSPENTSLRTFQSEGQILPLGIKGEGLFAHLKALSAEENRGRLSEITEKLTLIDWFKHFEIPRGLSPEERSIHIQDRYLNEGLLFDQRSANEGFLFLLFYFALFVSPDTPSFFAIDNIDASLNPKLCSELIKELVSLAKKHDKQAVLTTHNPAVLDGLDLNDDEQRLLVIYRNSRGHTKARRVHPPKPLEGEPPMKLSEAFLRGYIGGLPKNF